MLQQRFCLTYASYSLVLGMNTKLAHQMFAAYRCTKVLFKLCGQSERSGGMMKAPRRGYSLNTRQLKFALAAFLLSLDFLNILGSVHLALHVLVSSCPLKWRPEKCAGNL